ncbi:MAG: penicillin-binding transpeptidase domain-containing protein [Terriglobia bacterium]
MPPRKLETLASWIAISVFILTFAGPGSSPALSAARPPLEDVTPSTTTASKTATPPVRHIVHHVIHHRRRVKRRRRVATSRLKRSRTLTRRTHTASAHRLVASVHHRPVYRSHARRTVRRVRYRRIHHTVYRRAVYRRILWSPWSVPSFSDPTLGDSAEGQVESIREAAVKALGHWNGSVVVVDPNTGRILALVNEKLALTRGYVPCSTVKPLVALAGLNEGVINLSTRLVGMSGRRIDLTQALAHSDNRYFAEVGEMLGYQRVKEYAEELGYGERASLDVPDESPGVFPSGPPPLSIGGVGRLTSFGTGIDQTPLQMAAIASAIANGGTLYWLQYPRTAQEEADFMPKVRRVLTNIEPYIPDVRQGMAAAVLYGTARSAYNPEEDIFGKTGTCSEDGGRMGWFVSYSSQQQPKYVIVVMLRGGRQMFGPHAAEIAGNIYRSLLPANFASVRQHTPRAPELIHRSGE